MSFLPYQEPKSLRSLCNQTKPLDRRVAQVFLMKFGFFVLAQVMAIAIKWTFFFDFFCPLLIFF